MAVTREQEAAAQRQLITILDEMRGQTVDPEANLARQRAITIEIMRIWDAATPAGEVDGNALSHLAYELAELVQGLDEWIKKGGFLPRDWSRS